MVSKTSSILPKDAVALPGMANPKHKNMKTEQVVAGALPETQKTSFDNLKELKNLKVLNGKGLEDKVYYKEGEGFWIKKSGFVEFLKAIFHRLLGYTSNDKKVFKGLDEAVTKDLKTLTKEAKTDEDKQKLVSTLQKTNEIFESIRSKYESKGETRNQRAIESLQREIDTFVTQNSSSPISVKPPSGKAPQSKVPGVLPTPLRPSTPAAPADAGAPPPPPPPSSAPVAGGPPPPAPPPPMTKQALSPEEKRQKAAAEKAQKIANTEEALGLKEDEHKQLLEIVGDLKARGKRLNSKTRILRRAISEFSKVLDKSEQYKRLKGQEDAINFRITQLQSQIDKLTEEIKADTALLQDCEKLLSENPDQQEFQVETPTGPQARPRKDLEAFVREGQEKLEQLKEEKLEHEAELQAKEEELTQLEASDDWNTEVTVTTKDGEQTITLKDLHESVKAKKEKKEILDKKIVQNNSQLEVTQKSKDQLAGVIHGLKTTLATLTGDDAPEVVVEKKEVDQKGMAGAAMAKLNRMQSKRALGFGSFTLPKGSAVAH